MKLGGVIHRLAALVLFGCMVLGLPMPAWAHSYKSSGPVTVLYHAEPNDSPVAGQITTLNFFITDKTKSFVLSDCYCRVVIRDAAGKEVIVPLMIEGISGSSNEARARGPYTFKKGGVYEVELLATSKRLNGFKPFKLSYIQRVNAPPAGSGLLGGISPGWIIFIFSLGVLGLMAMLVWGQQQPGKTSRQSKHTERFKNPLLHYGFYGLLVALAIMTVFASTVYSHHVR